MFPQFLQTQIKIKIWHEGENANIITLGIEVMNLGKWLLKKPVRNSMCLNATLSVTIKYFIQAFNVYKTPMKEN